MPAGSKPCLFSISKMLTELPSVNIDVIQKDKNLQGEMRFIEIFGTRQVQMTYFLNPF